MVEVLAKDHFIDAIPDEDIRLRICQNKPATLRDSLPNALELESYQIASKRRATLVREAQLEDKPLVQQQKPSCGTEQPVEAVLTLLLNAHQHCSVT